MEVTPMMASTHRDDPNDATNTLGHPLGTSTYGGDPQPMEVTPMMALTHGGDPNDATNPWGHRPMEVTPMMPSTLGDINP